MKNKEPVIVTDMFAQCESCKMWDRLYPKGKDEIENWRTVPLRNVLDPKTKHIVKYICYGCYRDVENKCYDADLARSLTNPAFYIMFLKEVKKIKKRNN